MKDFPNDGYSGSVNFRKNIERKIIVVEIVMISI